MNVAKEQKIEQKLKEKAERTDKKPGRIAWLWMNMVFFTGSRPAAR